MQIFSGKKIKFAATNISDNITFIQGNQETNASCACLDIYDPKSYDNFPQIQEIY